MQLEFSCSYTRWTDEQSKGKRESVRLRDAHSEYHLSFRGKRTLSDQLDEALHERSGLYHFFTLYPRDRHRLSTSRVQVRLSPAEPL